MTSTMFKDTAGRTWSVEITIDTARRVRDRVGVDLLSTKLLDLLESVLGDLVLLCDVLFVIVEPQARERAVTDSEFGKSMAGDALWEGSKAFLEGIRLFTPNPRDRDRVGKFTRLLMKASEKEGTKQDEAMEALQVHLLGPDSGQPSSSSQALPASSPGDSHSGS